MLKGAAFSVVLNRPDVFVSKLQRAALSLFISHNSSLQLALLFSPSWHFHWLNASWTTCPLERYIVRHTYKRALTQRHPCSPALSSCAGCLPVKELFILLKTTALPSTPLISVPAGLSACLHASTGRFVSCHNGISPSTEVEVNSHFLKSIQNSCFDESQ